VATLSRELVAFARRRQLPFFCAYGGTRTEMVRQEPVAMLELERCFAAFPLDHDLYCDPFLSRHKDRVIAQLAPFQADLVHITGPGDVGILGFWVAHSLRIPLVASWHTNLHEYAARRLEKLLAFLPETWRNSIAGKAEHEALDALVWFYRRARFLMAPNQVSVCRLAERTGKPAFLMPHGVDTQAFSPQWRRRQTQPFCLGYVGRLTAEKNVRSFARIEESLLASGQSNFRIILIGDGGEKEWLRRNLRFAELPGILRGAALAEAYANMDVFVFPSRTDTYGLVLLEAMASGVPAVVAPETGACVGIRNGISGFCASDAAAMADSVLLLMNDPSLQRQMGRAAREFACSKSWDGVFEQVYRTYETGLSQAGLVAAQALPRLQ
jgi:phosphatidylinositol alpha 1,6-mannosyltransferase